MAEIATEVNNLRVPPQALDVEQAVLCAMMLDKEAIVKAIGKGLSLDLRDLEITDSATSIDQAPILINDRFVGKQWSIWDLTPADGYQAALALEGEGAVVSLWQWLAAD